MTADQIAHMNRCSPAERPHFRHYVERHAEEYKKDWGPQGETALIIDATLYADLMVHQPVVASELWPKEGT